MKKSILFLIVAFVFYLLGHLLWTVALIFEKPLFSNIQIETWLINIPFLFFAVFGLMSSIKLYQINKD
tara:strand:+ start:126 stop:329 length:204 start_codon:yes stop_codon:yes gene_type:complete